MGTGMGTGRRGSCGRAAQLSPSWPGVGMGGAPGTLGVQGWKFCFGAAQTQLLSVPSIGLHPSGRAEVETSNRAGSDTRATAAGVPAGRACCGRGGQHRPPQPRGHPGMQ